MPDFEYCEQRSPEWFAMRRGVITGSQADRLLTASKRITYARELAAETIATETKEQFPTAAMQWGIDHEPNAIARYALENDSDVHEVGFIWADGYHGRIGCSPDGLIGTSGAIEVKCPSTKVHVDHWIDGAPKLYLAQIQFLLWVGALQWCDFVSFDPRAPIPSDYCCRRYRRDEKMIAELAAGADDVLYQISLIMEIVGKPVDEDVVSSETPVDEAQDALPTVDKTQTHWPSWDADGILVDARSVPYSEHVYSKTKTCNADGSWRRRRGVSKAAIDAHEARYLVKSETGGQDEEQAQDEHREVGRELDVTGTTEDEMIERIKGAKSVAELDHSIAAVESHPAWDDSVKADLVKLARDYRAEWEQVEAAPEDG